MTKLLLFLCCLTISFCCCKNHSTSNSFNPIQKAQTDDRLKYHDVIGTWVLHNKNGFSLLEIKDSLHVMYNSFIDRAAYFNKIVEDRYWYYSSPARIAYYKSTKIGIKTDNYRFDYEVIGDTLIELEKTGYGGKFIKVYTDEEKAFKYFNSINLKGLVAFVSKENPKNIYVTKRDQSSKSRILDPDNHDFEYPFTDLKNIFSDYDLLINLASTGDSILKPAYSDTLILFNKGTKKYHRFNFVNR